MTTVSNMEIHGFQPFTSILYPHIRRVYGINGYYGRKNTPSFSEISNCVSVPGPPVVPLIYRSPYYNL